MEINRLGMQALYGAVSSSSSVGQAVGVGAPAERGYGRDEVGENPVPPSSTKVSLSAAAQSMLAAEQSAEVAAAQAPQNIPVQDVAEAEPVRNDAQNYTATAPADVAPEAVPLQQASVTQPTGAATPRSEPEVNEAPEASLVATLAAAEPAARQVAADPAVQALAGVPQSNTQVEEVAQESRVRQDVQAQGRQDVSPVLAQSGVAAYQEVLSL